MACEAPALGRRLLVMLSIAIPAAGTLAACAGDLQEPGRFSENYCINVTEHIFHNRCVFGCHGAKSQQGALDLESEGIASRLVGVDSLQCGVVLVEPTNPTASLLYLKLATSPQCGKQMPLYGEPLSGDQTDCVLEWIARQ